MAATLWCPSGRWHCVWTVCVAWKWMERMEDLSLDHASWSATPSRLAPATGRWPFHDLSSWLTRWQESMMDQYGRRKASQRKTTAFNWYITGADSILNHAQSTAMPSRSIITVIIIVCGPASRLLACIAQLNTAARVSSIFVHICPRHLLITVFCYCLNHLHS